MNEVAHLMIYAKMDKTIRHMASQQRVSAEEIEDNTPASDLGMMVTARMVLPPIADSIDPRGFR
jgi:hypothetical protein